MLFRVLGRADDLGIGLPQIAVTDYVNTIPAADEPPYPGDEEIEHRIRQLDPVERSSDGELAPTIASTASAAISPPTHRPPPSTKWASTTSSTARPTAAFGDQVFFQGHASPGIYARAFLEGRLDEADLDRFRREVGGGGLPSYPHPRRCDFWEFPTVSMGLGPLNAAYQARFNRYLHDRGIVDTSAAKVWCFAGDGEMDEPESLAGLALAGRERLDNLIFVVNCNLQRLDGPVRGNGKIIQELEGLFRGAGLERDQSRLGSRVGRPPRRATPTARSVAKMNATVDGEFQKYRVESGAYIREHFFGPDPQLQALVAHLSDDDLRRLRRGGHDPRKVHAAYRAAVDHRGAPTVVLAKTVKGWSLGSDFEARNATHQMKKMTEAELKTFRDRLELPITDAHLAEELPPYVRPGCRVPTNTSTSWSADGRSAAHSPSRVVRPKTLHLPGEDLYRELLAGTGDKVATSTTSAFTRLLRTCSATPRSAGESCRSSRTRPAPSASTPCSASRRSTHRPGNGTNRSTPTCCSATMEADRRPDPRGGHHRGGLDGVAHRCRNRVRHLGRADDPVLRLLLDVRVPPPR